MSNVAVNGKGDVVILKDGKWSPAPVSVGPKGDRIYSDGQQWLPVPKSGVQPGSSFPAGQQGAMGVSRPAPGVVSGLSPGVPAVRGGMGAPPMQSGIQQGSPLSTSMFGPKPKPTGFLPTDTMREFPYNTEEAFRSGAGMFEHGRQAVMRKGDLTGLVGMAGGVLGMTSAPGVGVLGTTFEGVVDPFISKPIERATGIPYEITDAVIGAAPLLGVRGRVRTPPPAGRGPTPPGVMPPAGRGPTPPGVMPPGRRGNWGEHVFSPTTIDETGARAERAIRPRSGEMARDTAMAEHELKSFSRGGADLGTEYDSWEASGRTTPKPKNLGLFEYMEGRSAGVQLPHFELQGMADALRKIMTDTRAKLQTTTSLKTMAYVEDYWQHNWADPIAANRFANAFTARQGRGGFTRKRTIPTIAEGIKAGLKLRNGDPVQTAMAYKENADRFIAHNRIVDDARSGPASLRDVKYFTPKRAPPGWVPLKGRLAEKRGLGGSTLTAYAPENWARVYNRFVVAQSKGEFNQLLDKFQKTSNMSTAWQLTLSLVHAYNITRSSWNSEFARAMGLARSGKPLSAMKAFGELPFTPLTRALLGRKGLKIYVGGSPGTAPAGNIIMQGLRRVEDSISEMYMPRTEAARAVQGMTDANMKVLKMHRDYLNSRAESFVNLFKRGKLFAEFGKEWNQFSRSPGALGPAKQAGKILARDLSRAMDASMYPMFQIWIPSLKRGFAMKDLADWYKAHPNATAEETQIAQQKIIDSVDNRFGEMNTDNIFWNRTLKKILQSEFISYGWNVGKLREMGGGVADATRGNWSGRSDYVVGAVATQAILASVLTWWATGQAPKSLRDLYAPPTGAKDEDGILERYAPQGDVKELFGFILDPALETYTHHEENKDDPNEANLFVETLTRIMQNVPREVYNKSAPFPKTVADIVTNRDWRNLPVAPPGGSDAYATPEHLQAYIDYLVKDMLTPQAVSAVRGDQARQGTGIGPVGRLFGMRPANQLLTDPEMHSSRQRRGANKLWQKKRHADAQALAKTQRYQGPQ